MTKNKTRVDTDQTLVLMKRFSDPVVKMLVHTPLTANQISVFSFVFIAPAVSYLLITGGYVYGLIALFILIIHSFLDLMDGELARQKKLVSRLGSWYENTLDPLMQLIVLMSIILSILLTQEIWFKYIVLLGFLGQSYAHILGVIATEKFRVDPLTGNAALNESVGSSDSILDFLLKNIMVPSHPFFVMILTMRFYLVFGIIFNQLFYAFLAFSIAISVRSFVLYLILTLHFSENPKLQRYAVFTYLKENEKK